MGENILINLHLYLLKKCRPREYLARHSGIGTMQIIIAATDVSLK
jgi:hypothetical protein